MTRDQIREGLRQRRETLGLTQVDVANLLAIRPETVSRWESGRQITIPRRSLMAWEQAIAAEEAKR